MLSGASAQSFVETTVRNAEQYPDQLFLRFLDNGEVDGATTTLTYRTLDRRARAIAARLQALGAQGQRALLLYAPGAEFIAAFFGCLYAGVIAVPTYPPDPASLGKLLPRLRAVAADAGATIALSTVGIRSAAPALYAAEPWLEAMSWIATDEIPEAPACEWRMPDISRDAVAFLQYTSGSTGAPKGVMLTHGNLLHNNEAIFRAFAYRAPSRVVSWLPPYHDMGLIGMLLQITYTASTVTLMSPFDFLKRPHRWLKAIHQYRAEISGAPDFGYALCTRKVSDEELSRLDLSSWSLAFSGAENVRNDTLLRFAKRFEAAGFNRAVFYPTYGLAEATLIVTGPRAGATRPTTAEIDKQKLARGQVHESAAEDAVTVVSCGQAVHEMDVRIVDPETRCECQPGCTGEVWVHGASVAGGYWSNPELTSSVFHAQIEGGDDRRYLRTGDLGFLRGGELYIVGRIKDIVVLNGRNIYPVDVERTVESCHAAIRKGCVAAFGTALAEQESVSLVAEVQDPSDGLDHQAILRRIRAAVATDHGISLHRIALLRAGAIPKTSSGKIQRYRCAEVFGSGLMKEAILAEAG